MILDFASVNTASGQHYKRFCNNHYLQYSIYQYLTIVNILEISYSPFPLREGLISANVFKSERGQRKKRKMRKKKGEKIIPC
jgi:hypothetical protein